MSVLVPNQRTIWPSASQMGSAGEEPAVLAVFAAQRERVLPRLAAVPRLLDALHNALDVVGVMHLLPAPALHLFQRRAGVIEPAPAVPVDPTLSVGHPREL